jgi:uncharacterized membrane protein
MRHTVELDVPAHVTYERMYRVEEYPLFRHGVRLVTPVSEFTHRWELTDATFTAALVERRPDEALRWHSVDGPPCGELVLVRPLSPRRSVLTIESSGPPALLAQLAVDLSEFKRHVERDHPAAGHHVNERPLAACRNRSNWREGLLRGRTSTGAWSQRRSA